MFLVNSKSLPFDWHVVDCKYNFLFPLNEKIFQKEEKALANSRKVKKMNLKIFILWFEIV